MPKNLKFQCITFSQIDSSKVGPGVLGRLSMLGARDVEVSDVSDLDGVKRVLGAGLKKLTLKGIDV